MINSLTLVLNNGLFPWMDCEWNAEDGETYELFKLKHFQVMLETA